MAPEVALPVPQTPSRKKTSGEVNAIKLLVEMLVMDLENKWGLGLQLLDGSPNKRQQNGASETKEWQVVHMIQVLGWRSLQIEPLREFEQKAVELYTGWKSKPKAERGVVPERTRNIKYSLSTNEKRQILDLLHDTLKPPFRELESTNRNRTLDRSGSCLSPTSRIQQIKSPLIDDSPLKISLPTPKPDPKRPREELFSDVDPRHKKIKTPGLRPVPLPESPSIAMPPPTERARPSLQESRSWRSETTSMSESIFSRSNHSFDRSGGQSTQETVPDHDHEDLLDRTQPNIPASEAHFKAPNNTAPSSDYDAGSVFEGSSFEEVFKQSTDVNGLLRGVALDPGRVDDSLSQELLNVGIENKRNMLTVEDVLQNRLDAVFPQLPPSLDVDSVKLYVIYEITRVFVYVGASMASVNFPQTADFDDYDKLWNFLQNLPELKGKNFPPKSERAAWEAAKTDFTSRGTGLELGVVFSGSLTYEMSEGTNPLFQFQLKPLTLDKKHRLSRRLGEDRFIQIDMPHLHGDFLPKSLQSDSGHAALLKWLVERRHWLFGRTWRPFHSKQKDRKDKKEKKNHKVSDPAHCVYFFAVDGRGLYNTGSSISLNNERPQERHTAIEVDALLNMVRLTRKNKHQPYLKLFSRTSLAVSRNNATVILERKEIRYKPDIIFNDEVMTDGAGRMSFALAQKVTMMLNLPYPASGFQGRIGEAKGFWSVDHSDRTGELWIEVYESQCKWNRSKSRDENAVDFHSANRTLEVLKPSGPLRSADLNLQFMPLLIERALDKPLMRYSLRALLIIGLQKELDYLQASLEDAPSLLRWVNEQYSSISERLRHGEVLFDGGMPMTLHERLIMLLDAGFEPKKLQLVTDLSKDLFKRKCDELKQRLNITVGKSTYVYMVPDFWGVLEPDEVYMDFSSFVDDVSGQSGVLLHRQDVLVARSPAHFVSDIQKVKAVAKVELIGLKDVIVFSTKGNPSLAAKLSGGDYDGDLAWLCWEPSIVNNFVDAEVPDVPDFVQQGFVRQDKTTYEELVKNQEHPVSHFLKCSLSFNMKQSMLGICTAWKETYCYNQGTVASKEATTLSALLSLLVDQAKQGYSFDAEDWNRLRKSLTEGKNVTTFIPEYKKLKPEFKKDAKHIIDFLMYEAHLKVDNSLTAFQAAIPQNIPQWDADLSSLYNWAAEAAKVTNEWDGILKDLTKDLEALKLSWSKEFTKGKASENPDDAVDFKATLFEHFEMYQRIQPKTITTLTHLLLCDYASPEYTHWSLLKASTLFSSFHKSNVKPVVWFMAGRQLVHLKSLKVSPSGPHAIVPHMYVCYKPNSSFIRQRQRRDVEYIENVGVRSVDEVDATQED
ncbi:hypothetical protein GLAREA_09297 [Glarea lozoyensis ATCC 20868]|uniref:RNA-dependent RNA polymerase n=1 Tax=Glarea lozoyensis (strain ATCC 20868 / MF5171) TaxID=1116229 RepID=S3DJ06_GLAL2|nr:uncharacterized protein GLAREA_09297 [Glarea lozoyensis ATCC 20868]EPE37134.1 hypothetical protein GLAREA_09297 [Glarea lozoyensis ATCC 20868]